MAKRRNFKSENSIKARARKALERNKDKHDPNERAKDFKGTVKKVMQVFSPEKWQFLIIAIASAGTAVFSIFGPNQLGNMISEMQVQVKSKIAGTGYDLSTVWRMLAMIVVVYVISCIATYIQQFTVAGLSQRIVFHLRKDVNLKLSKLPLKYFDAFSTLPLLYSIEINLPDIEFSATVTIVAYWTKLFASPIKPYVSLPSSRTKIGVRIKLMPVLMINETTAASIFTVICLLFDISFMPVNQSFTKAWGRL